ncbi:MAG: NFACT RNA binding domain-containing protein [Bacillota bacterium]|nr:NFACT RNA binding domain-containing protein [Bacillota bacterium]
MALDGIFLQHIMYELKSEATGSKVDKIYQPNKEELVISLRTKNGNKKLLLSARANSPRIHFTKYAPENPQSPPMFCMLLRKRLGSGKLIDIRGDGLERIMFLDFSTINELGESEILTLAIEIMGKYSNVILIDEQQKIIDALKRVDLSMSSQRLVLPNLKYELPPKQDKINILETSIDIVIDKILKVDKDISLNKAILNTLQGVSPVVCREIEFRSGSGAEINAKEITENQKSRLRYFLQRTAEAAQNANGKPYMIIEIKQKPIEFSFMNILQYGTSAVVKETESFSELLDEFYFERDSIDRMRVKSQDLLRLLMNAEERLTRKINTQQAELARSVDREQLRIYGDLLQANIHKYEKGSPFIEVEDFYNDMKPVRIKLNPALSITQNAQKYYKDYRKAKTAEQILKVQLQKGNDELLYLDTVFDSLSRASSERELSEIRIELMDEGYVKRQKGKAKPPAPLPPVQFVSSDGFIILVGRNNKQNDKLTLKTAEKNDIWFHTKNIPGAHTIIVTDGKTPPDSTILEAASLAAYNSKAKDSAQVPVDYTLVRYVSKPSSAKPGMVIYTNNKTVYVTPSKEIIKS